MVLIGIAIALVLALAGIVLLRVRKKPSGLRAHARRMVNDKKYSEGLSQRLGRRAALMSEAFESPPPADFEIAGLIDDLLDCDKDIHDAAALRLGAAEKRIIPFLLSAIDDLRCTPKRDEPGEYGASPLLRVCKLLSNAPCRVLGEKIGHLVDDSDLQLRSLAVEARSALGYSSESAFVLDCLNSEDTARNRSAEDGIDKAIKEKWIEPELVKAILAWAQQSIFDPTSRRSKWAVHFFAAHGGPEAIHALQSPTILSLENNRTIHFALEELAAREICLSRPLLESLIQKSLTEESWPWPWAFEPALRVLALTAPQEAARLASTNVENASETIAKQALDCARKLNRLPRSWDKEALERTSPSDEERALAECLVTCWGAVGPIGNGGLSQYFYNSNGDGWPAATRALRAVDYPEGAAALEKAAHMINAHGASPDRGIRVQQIAKLSAAEWEALDSLSSAFWGLSWERIELQFMLKHKGFFQRLRAAQDIIQVR